MERTEGTRGLSPLLFLTAILRARRGIAVTIAAAIVITTAVVLIIGPQYTATLAFLPSTDESQASAVAGLAAQFGVALPTGAPDQTPQFYAELIGTRDFGTDLVTTNIRVAVGKTANGLRDSVVTKRLLDWMKIGHRRFFTPITDAQRVDVALSNLKFLTVIPEVQTSILRVNVTTNNPDLSLAIAQRILDLVNVFNSERRSSQAGMERKFVEGRLATSRDSLTAAEDRMRAFLVQNRTYASSPTLTLEYSRLDREVNFQQQVVLGLMQAAEQARITEVRDTPSITVVETPAAPALPDRYGFLLKWILAGIVGTMLSVGVVAVNVVLQAMRGEQPVAAGDFERSVAETRRDLEWLLRPAGALWRRVVHFRGGDR